MCLLYPFAICYHQHKSILFYSSTMHWICSVCERFDESVRKFSIVPGHSTNSGWTARQFRAGTGFFFLRTCYESWVVPAGVPSALAGIGGRVEANNIK